LPEIQKTQGKDLKPSFMKEKPPAPHRERTEARIDETVRETDGLCREENLIPEATPDYQVAPPEDPAREERINSTAEKKTALMQSDKKK
jgi:hypothetical protein